MNSNEIIKKKEKVEAYFRKRWPKQTQENVSDFGAYCAEQWLSGRHPETSLEFLGIDFLRSFAHRLGVRGSSDLMSQPTRNAYDTSIGGLAQLSADSAELRRFDESSLLRDRRLSQKHRIVLILYFEWGFTLAEIGDLFSVSESRISQVLTAALSAQKKRIQAATASEDERARQRKEQEAISRTIQVGFELDENAKRSLEKICKEERQRVAAGEVQTMAETVFKPFSVNSF